MLLRYLTSRKRSRRQHPMPASTGLALRCHITLIHSKGMQWAKYYYSFDGKVFPFSIVMYAGNIHSGILHFNPSLLR